MPITDAMHPMHVIFRLFDSILLSYVSPDEIFWLNRNSVVDGVEPLNQHVI